MRVILAKTAGFCMGVKRAMDKALSIARNRPGPIYTHGPLIHNRQVIEMLEARGIRAKTDFEGVHAGTVLLRTHGLPPHVADRLRAAGLEVEDGTCPHVLKGQRSVARRSAEGYSVVIVGDRDHDEVIALAAHATGPCSIIASIEEAQTAPLEGKVLVVAQTTFNEALFREIVAALKARKPDIEVVESICDATSRRQEEARVLARAVDAMIVVGGRHSANTRRLAEVARSTGTPTFHVETADELDLAELGRYKTVGVTAGASTPGWITSAVIQKLRRAGPSRPLAARAAEAVGSFVIDGNVYVGAAAAALTYAVTRLLGVELASKWERAALMVAAFGYIFSAYTLARRADVRAGGGMTRRGAFCQAHPIWMGASSLLLFLVSIAVLARFGLFAVILLGLSYVLAAAYGVLLGPAQDGPSIVRRAFVFLRRVPASKDVVSAAGWTAVTVFVPVVAAQGAHASGVAVVAAFVFGLAVVRSVMFDFSDVTADRLLGRETLPALLGGARARGVLGVLTAALAIGLAAGASAGAVVGPGHWMLLCSAYVLGYLLVFGSSVAASEWRCALVVDGGMLLAGAIALVHPMC